MGLLDGYFVPEQFGEGGGLLGRLLALQQQQGQYQPGVGFDETSSVPQAPEPSTPWPGLSTYGRAPSSLRMAAQGLPAQYSAGTAATGPYPPVSDFNQSDIQKAGITSDQSTYCKTMKNLCHRQCFDMIFGRDAFGPYRACVRACMHNAGCYDF